MPNENQIILTVVPMALYIMYNIEESDMKDGTTNRQLSTDRLNSL